MTGLSGVGKTTFVENDIPNATIYKGQANLAKWAADQEDNGQYKILFLDEIIDQEFSVFEGLCNGPLSKREIVIGGKPYTLTDKHKIIFAGNPLNYGGGRKMASLFRRHGGSLEFKPMPLDYIYVKILKPIFENTPLEAHSLAVANEILARYHFVCSCSQDDVLMTPRELQTIAMLSTSYLFSHPDADILTVVRYYATLISRPLVPTAQQHPFDVLFPAHEKRAQPIKILYPAGKKEIDNTKTYIVTPSRQPIYQYVMDLLALRDFRRNAAKDALNEKQLYDGLGGAIFEGDPGVGKTDLLTAALADQGYHEIKDLNQDIPDEVADKAFYRIEIGMDLNLKIKALKKLYKKGIIAIIDEFNSAPMLEGLLNDLLMGKHPKGKRGRPGFMVLATENPVITGGRFEKSNALQHRTTTMDMPHYPKDELGHILRLKMVPEETATAIAEAFYLKEKELGLTFRALIEEATPDIKLNQHLAPLLPQEALDSPIYSVAPPPAAPVPQVAAPVVPIVDLPQPKAPVQEIQAQQNEPVLPLPPPLPSAAPPDHSPVNQDLDFSKLLLLDSNMDQDESLSHSIPEQEPSRLPLGNPGPISLLPGNPEPIIDSPAQVSVLLPLPNSDQKNAPPPVINPRAVKEATADEQIILAAKDGIKEYLKHRKPSIWSRLFFERDLGKRRANIYFSVLSARDLPLAIKQLAICALLNSKDGRTLQGYILKEINQRLEIKFTKQELITYLMTQMTSQNVYEPGVVNQVAKKLMKYANENQALDRTKILRIVSPMLPEVLPEAIQRQKTLKQNADIAVANEKKKIALKKKINQAQHLGIKRFGI